MGNKEETGGGKWNWELVDEMRGSPGHLVPGRGGGRIPIRIKVSVDETAVPVAFEANAGVGRARPDLPGGQASDV